MRALFVAASAIALLASTPAWAQDAASPHSLNSQDKMFIEQAGGGNLAEVALGRLAERRATNPAIQEFGFWMATDHHFANVRLAAIARKSGVTGFQPKLSSLDRELQQKLQGFHGAQFDRQYIQTMVRDHRATIPKFRKEAQYGENRLLKVYARNLLPVLHQHLAGAELLAGTRGVAVSGTVARPAAMSGSSIRHYNR
jgi:putative membrane protein